MLQANLLHEREVSDKSLHFEKKLADIEVHAMNRTEVMLAGTCLASNDPDDEVFTLFNTYMQPDEVQLNPIRLTNVTRGDS